MTSRGTRGGALPTLLAALTLLAGLAAAGPARAQDAEAEPPAEGAGAEAEAETDTAATRTEPEAEGGGLYERRPAPPVRVAVLGGRRVPDAIVDAARAALVEQLGPLAPGREVRAIEDEAALEAIAACEDDACVGAQIAEQGGQAGAILRIERGRRGYGATLELRDPVSGAPRREAVEGDLPRDAGEVPEALAALSAQLADAMPSPPPPPATLTVTVDVDGARVQVDGHDIGTSPVAPVDVAEGTHEIVVMAPGFASQRRQTRVRAGEQARVDVTLREIDPAAAARTVAAESQEADPWRRDEGKDLTEQWWFWTIIAAGAVALIGVAIGVGVAVSSDGGSDPMMPTQPDGIPLPPIVEGM